MVQEDATSTMKPAERAGRAGRVGAALRRAGAALVLALSVLGILLSLAGVVAVWRVKATLSGGGTTNLARLGTALGVANTGLQAINTNLDQVDDAQLADAGRTIAAIPGIVVAVNTTLAAVDEIPFISVPTIDSDQLQRIGERMATLTAAIDAARQRRAEASGSTSVAPDPQAIRAAAADLEQQVGGARARVTAAGESWPRWIDRGAIALTLLLAWLALAQAGLGWLAWGAWRRAAG